MEYVGLNPCLRTMNCGIHPWQMQVWLLYVFNYVN